MTWEPGRESVRLRTGTVQSVSGGRATVLLGGAPVPGVPSHGRVPEVGGRVLVLEQGASMLVLPEPGIPQADADARYGVGCYAAGNFLATTVPTAQMIRIGLAMTVQAGGFTISGSTVVPPRPGWYQFQSNVSLSGAVGSSRAFIDVLAGSTNCGRSPFGTGEDRASLMGQGILSPNSPLHFMVWQGTGAALTATTAGSWSVKFIGDRD